MSKTKTTVETIVRKITVSFVRLANEALIGSSFADTPNICNSPHTNSLLILLRFFGTFLITKLYASPVQRSLYVP